MESKFDMTQVEINLHLLAIEVMLDTHRDQSGYLFANNSNRHEVLNLLAWRDEFEVTADMPVRNRY